VRGRLNLNISATAPGTASSAAAMGERDTSMTSASVSADVPVPATAAAAAAIQAVAGPGDVVRLTYAAEQITSTDILRELGLAGQSYIHVAATAGVKRLRIAEWVGPPHQPDPDAGDPVLKFDEVMHQLIERRSARPLLSRTGERLYLRRAIDGAFAADPRVRDLVEHDLVPWLDALADLAARGLDLSQPLPPDVASSLVSRAVGDTLRTLQQAHRSSRPNADLRTFEEAADDDQPGGRGAVRLSSDGDDLGGARRGHPVLDERHGLGRTRHEVRRAVQDLPDDNVQGEGRL
jgi:hypothetical protein